MQDPIKVFGQVAGADVEEIELAASSTVAELRATLGLDDRYSARILATDAPVADGSTLSHGTVYLFAKNLQGGASAA